MFRKNLAFFRVGGDSQVTQNLNHDILIDGISAIKNSIKFGIIPGGGVSLLNASTLLEGLKGSKSDFNKGV